MANYTFDAARWCRSMAKAHHARKDFNTASTFRTVAEEIDRLLELREAVRAARRLEKRLESECGDETEWKTAYCQLQHARAEVDRLLGGE